VGVGAVGLLTAALLGWLATPLQGPFKGYSFPLVGNVILLDAVTRPVRLLSFGAAAALLGIATGVAAWRRATRTSFWLGSAAVLLAVYFAGSAAFLRPGLMDAVVEQNLHREDLKQFDARHVLGNAARMYVPELQSASFMDRVSTGLRVYGFGWELTLAAGIWLQVHSARRGRQGLGLRLAGFGVLFGLLVIGVNGRAAAAEYSMIRGDAFDARGAFDDARQAYERARRWNPGLDHNPVFQDHLGEVYSQLGLADRTETLVYRGNRFLEHGLFAQALDSYERALAMRSDNPVARRRRVEAHAGAGRAHFTALEPHKAIGEWEKAAALDPHEPRIFFFLAKAYFDVRRNEMGIWANQAALARTWDPLVRSDLFIMLGDCHYRRREFVLAREAYQASIAQYTSVTYLLNYLARQKLQGI
jgi:tetratricopeptide (TPR) repeat protein